MYKGDAEDALPILDEALAMLLEFGPVRGRTGADLRRAIGYTRTEAARLLQADDWAPFVDGCFNLARIAGVRREEFAQIREVTRTALPLSLASTDVRDAIVQLCLATEALVIGSAEFFSRNEVDALRTELTKVFNELEEDTADSMDPLTYQALIGLRASLMNYLVETARPMPRMLRFQFTMVMPTLVQAHWLYGDAGRADEIRIENRVKHPAFAPRWGRALSR